MYKISIDQKYLKFYMEIEKPKTSTEERIGKYKVLKTLGKGASSIIKLGFDTEHNRYCVLKILTAD